jgi:McrBC 5-methylcytosine restriction system component
MTYVDAEQGSGIALARELTLFEYGPCADPVQAAMLYHHLPELQPYLKEGWLTLAFDKDHKPQIRGTDRVGILPFSVKDKTHLLLVAPKGCQQNPDLGLLRFLQLLAFVEGGPLPEVESGWEGKLGPHRFLLFLAHHYARLLRELCRRDFRSYYRAEEDELRGHIRGRLNLSVYARRAVQGKPHILPCRWDEFTVDNWDNRILWAAARRLKTVAAALDPQAARRVWEPFRHLLSWFGPVAELPITTADFHKSRLGRMSPYYRRALVWARLLLQGGDLPGAGGQAPPLVLDAPAVFEKFAEAVARASLPDASWHPRFQHECSFSFVTRPGQQDHIRTPDILLSGPDGLCAVGDTKYKDVLERAASADLGSAEEVLKVGIQAADWNQLYVYMRMKGASSGFFVVPFWNADGEPFEWKENFRFTDRSCDSTERVAVLALNLLKPLANVKLEAAERLRTWLSVTTR